MFRVLLERDENNHITEKIDTVMKTETLYNVLGRFLLIYGPPLISEDANGIKEVEYYKQVGKGHISASVVLARIKPDGSYKVKTKTSSMSHKSTQPIHVEPKAPPEPNHEFLDEMIKAGVIEQANYYR